MSRRIMHADRGMAETNVQGRLTLRVQHAPVAGVALVAAGAAMWGLDGGLRAPLVTGAGPAWSAWTIVLYEHVILTTLVAAHVWRNRAQLRRLDRAGWLSAIGIGWGGSAIATLAFTDAFRFGNPDVVVLLQKTQPLWAMAAAVVVVGERPRRAVGAFLVPAAIGTYLLSFGAISPSQAMADGRARGALEALAAAALWGAATAFGRRALRHVDSSVLTGLRFTLALPLLAAIAVVEGALAPPAGAVSGDWVRLPLLALLPGLIAMLLYYRGLRTTPAPVATLAELAFPATALIVNYVALGATVDAAQLFGFGILWATIAGLHRLPVRVPARAPAPQPA
jgi:drug/metabolite transporter (DMT)-like permease